MSNFSGLLHFDTPSSYEEPQSTKDDYWYLQITKIRMFWRNAEIIPLSDTTWNIPRSGGHNSRPGLNWSFSGI